MRAAAARYQVYPQCAEAQLVWELLEDVHVVQDELSEVLDVKLVVVSFADLVEELVLGEAVLRELRVVEMERLTVLRVAADVL